MIKPEEPDITVLPSEKVEFTCYSTEPIHWVFHVISINYQFNYYFKLQNHDFFPIFEIVFFLEIFSNIQLIRFVISGRIPSKWKSA